MDVFASGAWRTVTRAEVYVNGTWRKITRAELYIGSAWRSALSFGSPLSLSVTPAVTGSASSTKPKRVTSSQSQAVPTGGNPPYSYAWVMEGDIAINNQGQSGSTFSAFVPQGSELTGVATVTCTDASGNVATGSTQISLINDFGGL